MTILSTEGSRKAFRKNRRAQAGSNHRPVDLQSTALPLSYTPNTSENGERAYLGSFSLSLPMHASRDTPEDNNNAGSPTGSRIGGSHPPTGAASRLHRSSGDLQIWYLFIMWLRSFQNRLRESSSSLSQLRAENGASYGRCPWLSRRRAQLGWPLSP